MLVGGVHARYADSISGTASMTTLRVSASNQNAAGVLTGSLSKFSGNEWVTQFSGFGTAVLPVGKGMRFGASVGGDVNHIQGGNWNGQASGGLLGALTVNRTLFTAGASVGTARTFFDSTIATGTLSARLQQLFGQSTALSGGLVTVSSDTIRYADFTLDLTYSSTGLRASLGGGMRVGDLEDSPWGQGRFEYDPAPRFTLELSVGRYPQSLVGFTDGLFASTGIRVWLTTRPRRGTAPAPPVQMEPLGAGRVRLTIKYSGKAETIELAGVWNGWLPVAMERVEDGTWSTVLTLEPGIYQYAIVVDGSTWTVPDGVPSEPDDFGGEVATLVVAGDRGR